MAIVLSVSVEGGDTATRIPAMTGAQAMGNGVNHEGASGVPAISDQHRGAQFLTLGEICAAGSAFSYGVCQEESHAEAGANKNRREAGFCVCSCGIGQSQMINAATPTIRPNFTT